MQIQGTGKGPKGIKWLGMALIALALLKTCLCVELIKYLGDKSGAHGEKHFITISSGPQLTSVGYTTRWCCDHHEQVIDFVSFGLRDVWDGKEPSGKWQFVYETFGLSSELN